MICEENQTQVTQIHLLGFQSLHRYKTLLFIVFLLTYIFILGGNFLIILLVTIIDHLKTPMFFFLKHLSITDVLLTTTIVPMMLNTLFVEEGLFLFWGCMLQMFFFFLFGQSQCFLIAIMSYDRYLAICHPLRYSTLMSPDHCLQLVFWSWFLAFVFISSSVFVVFQFNFCGLNYIDHFFCDFAPIVKLATSDTSILVLQDFVISSLTLFSPFVFIIFTYICILFTILKITSTQGRKKSFSTCSSHLTLVCAYYGTVITVYVIQSDESTTSINKYRSLLYTVVTPLMNPIIYSLRNKEINRAVKKLIIETP